MKNNWCHSYFSINKTFLHAYSPLILTSTIFLFLDLGLWWGCRFGIFLGLFQGHLAAGVTELFIKILICNLFSIFPTSSWNGNLAFLFLSPLWWGQHQSNPPLFSNLNSLRGLFQGNGEQWEHCREGECLLQWAWRERKTFPKEKQQRSEIPWNWCFHFFTEPWSGSRTSGGNDCDSPKEAGP